MRGSKLNTGFKVGHSPVPQETWEWTVSWECLTLFPWKLIISTWWVERGGFEYLCDLGHSELPQLTPPILNSCWTEDGLYRSKKAFTPVSLGRCHRLAEVSLRLPGRTHHSGLFLKLWSSHHTTLNCWEHHWKSLYVYASVTHSFPYYFLLLHLTVKIFLTNLPVSILSEGSVLEPYLVQQKEGGEGNVVSYLP